MAKIPRSVHFVFGLREQNEPFHLLHYLAIESCRQVVEPERIYLHYHHLPFGVYWELARPHLTLQHVGLSEEVENAEFDEILAPEVYRYAHHADFVRLDALIEHGGIYADIDTLFIRAMPDELFEHRFVIGREADMKDEITGQVSPSFCNALMLAEPGSQFARRWRHQMAEALNGSWSNHSCLLPQRLAQQFPDEIHIEPIESFMGIPVTPSGITAFLEGDQLDLAKSYSVHWWQHLWWEEERQDFCQFHAGRVTLQHLRDGTSPLCQLARPFLPDIDLSSLGGLGHG